MWLYDQFSTKVMILLDLTIQSPAVTGLLGFSIKIKTDSPPEIF